MSISQTDTLHEITSYLLYHEIINLSEVCKGFHEILANKINRIKNWYNSRAMIFIISCGKTLKYMPKYEQFVKYYNNIKSNIVIDSPEYNKCFSVLESMLIKYIKTINYKIGDLIYPIGYDITLVIVNNDKLISSRNKKIIKTSPKFYENFPTTTKETCITDNVYDRDLQCWI